MAAPTVTNTFTNGTTANATEVNTNFSDIISALTDGTKDITVGTLGATTGSFTTTNSTILRSGAGSVGTPSHSAIADTDTGIYFPAANQFAVAVGGANAFTCTSTIFSTSLIFQAGAGSASAPSIAFVGDTDTGLFSTPNNNISFACGGNELLRLFSGGQLGAIGGTTAAAPFWTSVADQDTGFYLPGSNVIGFATAGVSVGSIDANGLWTLGVASGTQIHAINGLAVQQTVSSASQASYRVQNTGAGDAVLITNVSGAGDPHIHFSGSGLGTTWHTGVDNSASDIFVLGTGTVPGTATMMSVSTAGLVTIGASGGSQTHQILGRTETRYPTAGSAGTCGVYHLDNTNGASHAELFASVGGTSGGDPFCLFDLPSGTNWCLGTDNSDSDNFKICQGSALTTGAAQFFSIASATGSITLGASGTSHTHTINCASGTTVGAAGGASALPATPTGYITININGTDRKIPYYAT